MIISGLFSFSRLLKFDEIATMKNINFVPAQNPCGVRNITVRERNKLKCSTVMM